jgi:glutaredoxin-related protein
MYLKSAVKDLPQIFSEGEFKGLCEQLDEANEFGELKKFLGV